MPERGKVLRSDKTARGDTRRQQRPPHEPKTVVALRPVPPKAAKLAGIPPTLAAAKQQRADQAAPFNTVGAIDGLIGSAVFGWAYDRDYGRRRVKITMYVNETLAVETVANGLRREKVGIGNHDGFSGFVCPIPFEKFSPGAVVRIFADGTELTTVPLVLGPRQFDGIFEPLNGAVASGWLRERVREPTRAVLDMVIDGEVARTVIADRLREELKTHGVGDGCFGFAETLPPACFDGAEHVIEFRHRASEQLLGPGARRFRAHYAGVLERLDQHGGHGWVSCHEAPPGPIPLDIVVNGERVRVIANIPRADVRKVRGTEGYGFEFGHPGAVSRHHEINVEIFVAGTDNPAIPGPFSFTPLSRVIEQLETIAAELGQTEATAETSRAERPYSAVRDAIIPGIVAALRSHNRSTGTVELGLQLDLPPFRGPAPALADIVDVVIPVYSGYDETIACIESVLRAANAVRREIILVDDCGPDPQLRAALQNYARAGAVTLVVNSRNLGFPAAANAGMALHPDRDVILLNADTLVPRGWIDRLRETAYRSGNTGSVTPLSNRATICSYPEINKDNDLPADMGWEALDQLCAAANGATAPVELPTAIGFCTYLRRAMLREVGLLNTDRWSRGYGEENELCILAAGHGWKHVMAPNLFVVHHGAVSFGADDRKALLETNMGTLNRLYPDYIPRVMEFLRDDPAAAARRAVDWARLKRLSKRFMLFVSHANGGGTAVHVEDMAERLAAQDHHVLILEANADTRGTATLRNLALGTRSVYALPRETDALIADLRGCGIWHIHIHHIMGGAQWATLPALLGCPYDVTVHDYSFFCPRIDLIDERGQYCGEPPVDVCERCIALNEPHLDLQGAFRDRGDMAEWLRLHHSLLIGARRVFTPSRDTALRLERHIPGVKYEALWHPEAARRVVIRRPASSGAARVAVIGAIGPNKGYQLLVDCARDALTKGLPIQYRLFGYAADEVPLRRLDNVQLIGEYQRTELLRLIAQNPCDVALFLSIWPETYCYALTDAYEAGLYPMALGFGALEERIAASQVGTILPLASTPTQINTAILAEVARADRWPAAVQIGEDVSDVLADYYQLQIESSQAPRATRRRNRS
jgi:GT2 family glycosyltransferase/glycosyltransferase involved in cell wall biosynthesis